MRTLSSCAALIAALSSAGCTSTLPPAPDSPLVAGDPTAPGPAMPKPGPAPAADVAALARGDNRFAADLFARIRQDSGNLVVSPASISAAIAMTYAGARGETAEEIRRAMHYDLDPDRLHRAYADTMRAWNGEEGGKDRGYKLAVANRLFGQQGYGFLPAFLGLSRDLYGAELQQVDFAGAPDPSRQIVNRWVDGKTAQKIRDLLPEGSITNLTTLVLTNAIYFKGRWASAFDKNQTGNVGFTLASGEHVQVPTMHQEGRFGYASVDGVQILEMPYQGGDLSMAVLLPDRADGLPDLERRLDAAHLDRWISATRPQQLPVRLPRFKIAPAKSLALADTLEAMGMRLAFREGLADLSGMAGAKNLYVKNVFHKGFVEVNEEGTEAAASTAVVVNRESAAVGPSFHADHPFVFVIRETRTGRVLFLGRVADPRA